MVLSIYQDHRPHHWGYRQVFASDSLLHDTLTGISLGYVGGNVLSALLKFPDTLLNHEFHAIVCDSIKAKKLVADEFGVKAVVGSHSDQNSMVKEASEVDVVIAMADCDDVGTAAGIVEGMKTQFEVTEKTPVLIHTSGTGVLADTSTEKKTEMIWDDKDVEQLRTIKPVALHYPVELLFFEADTEGRHILFF
ncbi:hypothetical protein PQX77_020260 [Marasmius sp. AFHP31]|nr:hypothetical protein PQX77_020260 [Marasmius sp. AFHP31]